MGRRTTERAVPAGGKRSRGALGQKADRGEKLVDGEDVFLRHSAKKTERRVPQVGGQCHCLGVRRQRSQAEKRWRPLTENEKVCVERTLFSRKRSVRWSGSQIASRTWAFRHQGHGRQSASKSCSSNSAGGCQTHALHSLPGECQNVVSSCDQWKGHGTWSSPADGQFLLEASHEGRCTSEAHC